MQYRQQQEVGGPRPGSKTRRPRAPRADQLKSTQEDANAPFMSDYEQAAIR